MDSSRRKEVDFKVALPVVTQEEPSTPVPVFPPISLPEPLGPPSAVQPPSEEDMSPYLRVKQLDFDHYEADSDDLQFLTTISGRADAYMEFERIIEAWESETGKETPISFDTATQIITSSLPLREIYDYWLNKREILQHSIWRKYWKSDVAQDSLIKQIFNLRKTEKMRLRISKSVEETTCRLFWRVKDDLEEGLDLLSCLEARERLKLHCVELEIARQEQVVGSSLYPEFVHPHAGRLVAEGASLLDESQYLRSDQQYLELLVRPRTVLDLAYSKELPTRQLRSEMTQAVAQLRRSLEEIGL